MRNDAPDLWDPIGFWVIAAFLQPRCSLKRGGAWQSIPRLGRNHTGGATKPKAVATTPDSPFHGGRQCCPSQRHCWKRQLRSSGQLGRDHDRDHRHATRSLYPCLEPRACHLRHLCHGHPTRLARTQLDRPCQPQPA
eukprot:326118-Pleurochrysis_carterae.AAC.2